MPALFFGSIGSVVETSEIQREAFNRTFARFGLDWRWDRTTYARLLRRSGGRRRIADYAEAQGIPVDVDALHHAKSEAFQEALADTALFPRAGVIDMAAHARAEGWALGFVTTTEASTVDLIAQQLRDRFGIAFDVVTTRRPDRPSKPDPAAYFSALDELGVAAREVLAVEDNPDGVAAAAGAGLYVVGFPGANIAPEVMTAADVLAPHALHPELLSASCRAA